MTYLIGKFYVQYPDGSLVPCQNYATAKYLVDVGDAEKIVDVTTQIMSVKDKVKK